MNIYGKIIQTKKMLRIFLFRFDRMKCKMCSVKYETNGERKYFKMKCKIKVGVLAVYT